MMEQTTRDVPRAALQFDAGPVRFGQAAEGVVNECPIDLQIRSPEPIEHWYWGRIVHDMKGMKIRKDTLPLDYRHDYGEIVGVGSSFVASEETGLSAKGKLVSVKAEDRADEIIKKGKAGIPYENSLDWSGPARIEWVDEGITVLVNGRDFAGPGYVAREWNVQAVAVCPHGADGSTRTKFSAEQNAGNVSVTLFSSSEIPSMSVQPPKPAATQDAAKPAPVAAETAAVEITTPTDRAQFQAELAKFTSTFGGENGAKWFAGGMTFEAATGEHNKLLAQQLAAKDTEIADLQQKLSVVNRGEESPATFSVGKGEKSPEAKDPPAKFANLGTNAAKVAGGLKFAR